MLVLVRDIKIFIGVTFNCPAQINTKIMFLPHINQILAPN